LARLLGATPAAIYERQRALVRDGLLSLPPGHGPGSGIRVNVPTVAMLLLSIMASPRLADSARRTLQIAHARPEGGGRCAFTGARTFLTAIEALLVRPEHKRQPDKSITGLLVSHTCPRAAILYRAYRDPVGSEALSAESIINFGAPAESEPPLRSMAVLRIETLEEIAQDLAAMSAGMALAAEPAKSETT
jgi:hypothetical protein